MIVNPFNIFLFRQVFVSLPDDVYEAAQLDHCGALKYFFTMVLPMSKSVVERTGGGIVSEHLTHFFFRETYHLVEFRCERVVGSDIETACEVVHCHRAYAGDETPLDAGVGSGFDFIEEGAQITFAMCFVRIAVQAFYVR